MGHCANAIAVPPIAGPAYTSRQFAEDSAMIRKQRNTIIAACMFAALASCGGGDTADTTVPNPTGDGLAAISLENSTPIAGAVAGVALGDGVFGTLLDVDLPAIPGGVGTILTGATKYANPSQVFETVSGSLDCAVSGTVDIDVTIADPFLPTEGDIYALQFTACDEGTGTVTNGGMIIAITGLGGDFGTEQFLLGLSLELSAFQVTEAGETTGASGTIAVEFDSTMPPLTTITVSTSALATSGDSSAEAVTNLTVTISEDESMFPTAVSVDTSFTISSPTIGGEVMVSTSLTLQSSGDEYPYVGELRITGAENSIIVLIALDANRVRLEIDIGGDGTIDDSVEMTWDELLATPG